jgi:hypothetical protein
MTAGEQEPYHARVRFFFTNHAILIGLPPLGCTSCRVLRTLASQIRA